MCDGVGQVIVNHGRVMCDVTPEAYRGVYRHGYSERARARAREEGGEGRAVACGGGARLVPVSGRCARWP
jgi:hypothetical protein